MARRVSDFRCEDCKTQISDILYSNVNDGVAGWPYFTETEHNLTCPNCNSTNIIKLLTGTHHSSDGGKGIGSRTPDGFKDVLKAIQKGTPEKFRGDRINSI